MYKYQDPWGTYKYTRKQILDEYFEHWKAKMIKIGKEDLISEERCIEDWLIVNWGWWEDDK